MRPQKKEYKYAPRLQLKARRVALGMNQTELAEAVGVELGAISSWERGERTPQMRRIESLAKALQMDTVDVLRFFTGGD